jgi:hypothetical protein
LSLPHSTASNGVRVLPPLPDSRITRRRSSVDVGGRCQSTPHIYTPTSNKKYGDSFLKKANETNSTSPTSGPKDPYKLTHSGTPTPLGISASSSAPYSHATASSTSVTSYTTIVNTPSTIPSSTITSMSSTTPATDTPQSSDMTVAPPFSTTSSSAALDTRDNPDTSLINSPRSSNAQTPNAKPNIPTRANKLNLKVVVNNDHDSSSDENNYLPKTKSVLNVSYNSTAKANESSPSLPTQHKIRPLPATPVFKPSSSFPGILGSSPPVPSPRAHHTPPKRPLPALPTPKSDSHPTILRRNTVHSDMHVATKGYDSPTRKDFVPDWLPFVNTQKYL